MYNAANSCSSFSYHALNGFCVCIPKVGPHGRQHMMHDNTFEKSKVKGFLYMISGPSS